MTAKTDFLSPRKSLFTALFGFACLMQLESLWVLQANEAAPWSAWLRGAAGLGLQQGQHLLIGLLVACSWGPASATRIRRLGLTALASALLLLLVVDQAFYSVFFDHLQLHFTDEAATTGIAVLASSLAALLSPVFYVNLGLWAVVSAWLARKLLTAPAPGAVLLPGPGAWTAVAVAVYLLAGAPMGDQSSALPNHPLLTLVKNAFIARGDAKAPEALPPDQMDLSALRWGKPRFSAASEKGVLAFGRAVRARPKRTNVIYLVWESVGSLNLLDADGLPDPRWAPHLRQYAPHLAVFPRIYCTFPATVRSHMSLTSGGLISTYGDLAQKLALPWTGPALATGFKQGGYATGVFAASFLIDPEDISLYRRQDWDAFVIPDFQPAAWTQAHKLNGWGVREDAVLPEAEDWILARKGRPFFLQFLTSAPHHPYSVPPGYAGPFKSDDALSRHRNSIHYLDSIVASLVDFLRQQGLDRNTVIAITGDHGEAFGDIHAGNFLHKHCLYEENIRDFLLVVDPAQTRGPAVSSKDGWTGDVMPSLLGLASVPCPAVPGENLFDERYRGGLRFFHKNEHPEKWGLLDGRWKFIGLRESDRDPELYDLAKDPREQVNLASRYPQRVALYRALCSRWYVQADAEFMRHTQGGGGEFKLSPQDAENRFPEVLDVGYLSPTGFDALAMVHPLQRLSARIRAADFAEDTLLTYEWTSPSGHRDREDFLFKKQWESGWVSYEPGCPLEAGLWELRVFDGAQELKSVQFTVNAEARLAGPRQVLHPVRLNSVQFGTRLNGVFKPLTAIHPRENMLSEVSAEPFPRDQSLTYAWVSPDGQVQNLEVPVSMGWDTVWAYHGAPEPMKEGSWLLNIYLDGRLLISKPFEVSAKAALFEPQVFN